MEELFTVERLEPEYEAAAEYSDKAINQITLVHHQINELEQAEASAATTLEQEVAPQLTRARFASTSGLRLSRLELPIFKEHLSHWLSFREQYQAAIHSN